MRKKLKKQNGATVVKKFFALFPVTIDGERRWLENVKVKGHYERDILDCLNFIPDCFVD